MTRIVGPFRASVAVALSGIAVPALLTGCMKTMTFPSASIAPSFNESPIQQAAGQFRPVVFVSEVHDNRPDLVAGAIGGVKFTSDHEMRSYVKKEVEGQISSQGVPLAMSQTDAQSQSHSYREVAVSIRSADFGAASGLTHKTLAGINLLVQVNDETGRPVFAQTYFGSAEKYPTWSTAKQSGELMAAAVSQATRKALSDTNFRTAIGL